MKQIKLIRYKIFKNFYWFLYKIFGNEKYKNRSRGYQDKYSFLSRTPFKKFRKYIKKREKLPLCKYEKIAAFLPYDVISDEIWAWNDYYGIGDLYKKYAGYPLDYKLKFVIDHAVYFYNNHLHPDEYKVQLPAHMCTSAYAENIMAPYLKTKLYPTGLHMLYADDYYDERVFKKEKKKLGKNLLVFPCHSSDCLVLDWKPDKLIKEILKVKEEHNFDSVTICFYFCEIQRKFHKNFEGYGFNFVTAGHILDPMFLSRLKTIIKLSDVTMSNDIGSHVFYSIGMNKPHYIVPENNIEYRCTSGSSGSEWEKNAANDVISCREDARNYMELFSIYTEELTEQQKAVRDKISGFESFKKPEEIKEFFQETERLYNEGDYLKYKEYTHNFTMMSYVQRCEED